MEKNMILTQNDTHVVATPDVARWFAGMKKKVVHTLRMPMVLLQRYYSTVLEKPVSMKQTKLLVEAQAAFVIGVFPVDGPILFRILSAAWLVWAVWKCKQADV